MTLVLVVEDSPTIASFTTTSLQLGGFDVRQRVEGFASLLDETDPDWRGVDVLFCDLMLPNVLGSEILTFAAEHFPDIRRVLFTAVPARQADETVGETAIIIHKPATTEEIQAAAAGALLRRRP